MNVGSFGFPEDQLSKVEKILKLSRNNRYELVSFDKANLPDLLLIFEEKCLSSPEIGALPQSYHSRLIIVSRDKPSDPSYSHIGYPLVSSRVIRALDQMTNENEEWDPEAIAEAEQQADSRFSKYETQVTEQESITRSDSYKVLVVDDSAPMQQALALELQKLPEAVEVEFADDGESALEKVASQRFDFIFLDIMMPGIDGFETCTRMRQMPELKKTPIIMLSSKTSPLDEVKGIMAGCSTYLTKPIDQTEFQKVINRVSKWVDEFRKA